MDAPTKEGQACWDSIRPIPDVRSLRDHGPYSAYCQVCWYSVYKGWIDDNPHCGVCPHGHLQAELCHDAMTRAREAAELKRAP